MQQTEGVRLVTEFWRRTDKGVAFAVEDTVEEEFYPNESKFYDGDASSLRGESLCTYSREFHTGNALIDTLLIAWKHHQGVSLSPDAVWASLVAVVGVHVQRNAEELRKHFVKHEGKLALVVELFDVPRTADDWETLVFGALSEKIRHHVGAETHALITGSFSTTTRAMQAVFDVLLMATVKSYFSYGACLTCGIPYVELQGTVDDWRDLRDRAALLERVLTPQVAKSWLPKLLPVLDEFVSAADGRCNHAFWQKMICQRSISLGCYSREGVTGWINMLFPFDKEGYFSLRESRELDDYYPLKASAEVYTNMDFVFKVTVGCFGHRKVPNQDALEPVFGWTGKRCAPSPAEVSDELTGLSRNIDFDPASAFLAKWLPRK